MAGELKTIARPYAEAVFASAQAGGTLDEWSDMLALLAGVVQSPDIHAAVNDPLLGREKLTELLLEICGDHLQQEGRNLVRLLVRNHRMAAAPAIADMFEKLKAESLRRLNVHIRTAYPLAESEIQQIAEALKVRLDREITVTSEEDPDLIGGVHIRAGDLVVDGSIRGRLQRLGNELGI